MTSSLTIPPCFLGCNKCNLKNPCRPAAQGLVCAVALQQTAKSPETRTSDHPASEKNKLFKFG